VIVQGKKVNIVSVLGRFEPATPITYSGPTAGTG